jgi:FkbH-like protein
MLPDAKTPLFWLPEIDSFAQALAEIGDGALESEPGSALARLREIADHRLDFLQTNRLAKRLASISVSDSDEYQSIRIAIIGGAEMQHLKSGIQVGCLRRGFLADVRVGGFGQFRQEIETPSSWLSDFKPNVVLLAIPAANFLKPVALDASSEDIRQIDRGAADELTALWRRLGTAFGAAVIQQMFLDTGEPIFGHCDRKMASENSARIADLNASIARVAAANGVHLLDLDGLARRLGRSFWYDETIWHKAKIEIRHDAAPLYGDHVARIAGAILGRSRKCLVLDLDNTLWGGVIGDDGLGKIRLGQGDPIGEAFQSFQSYCKRLAERGVILAICSKNERATAEIPFRESPDMILRLDDISAFVANWQDKASNLRMIAETLNIGLDALVLFDDNPAERMLVRRELPMVAVPEVPEDPSYFANCLSAAGYFETVAVTSDDFKRTRQYAQSRLREESENRATDMDAYLADLGMELSVGPFNNGNIQRVTQLINKTNQFNLTTRRKTEAEVMALAGEARILTLQGRLVDRFGDNGLICVAIVTPTEGNGDEFEIETWLMSCRVFGRQVEHAFLNEIVERTKGIGAKSLLGRYRPTNKNKVVEDLYAGLGFQKVETTRDRETCWRLQLADFREMTTKIKRASAP